MNYSEIKFKITQQVYGGLRNLNDPPSLFNIKFSPHYKRGALSEIRSLCITFSEIIASCLFMEK